MKVIRGIVDVHSIHEVYHDSFNTNMEGLKLVRASNKTRVKKGFVMCTT